MTAEVKDWREHEFVLWVSAFSKHGVREWLDENCGHGNFNCKTTMKEGTIVTWVHIYIDDVSTAVQFRLTYSDIALTPRRSNFSDEHQRPQ